MQGSSGNASRSSSAVQRKLLSLASPTRKAAHADHACSHQCRPCISASHQCSPRTWPTHEAANAAHAYVQACLSHVLLGMNDGGGVGPGCHQGSGVGGLVEGASGQRAGCMPGQAHRLPTWQRLVTVIVHLALTVPSLATASLCIVRIRAPFPLGLALLALFLLVLRLLKAHKYARSMHAHQPISELWMRVSSP